MKVVICNLHQAHEEATNSSGYFWSVSPILRHQIHANSDGWDWLGEEIGEMPRGDSKHRSPHAVLRFGVGIKINSFCCWLNLE